MFSIADVKNDLPLWDEDVIEQWPLYFANEPDCGWPPPDPLGDHRWNGLLGGKPLSWWREIQWEKKAHNCDPSTLTPKARRDVVDLVRIFRSGLADKSTARRIAQPWIYIRDHGTFPRAPLLIRKPDGWSIIDGSHRMAAFEIYQDDQIKLQGKGLTQVPRSQDVWVGTHSAGEVPDG